MCDIGQHRPQPAAQRRPGKVKNGGDSIHIRDIRQPLTGGQFPDAVVERQELESAPGQPGDGIEAQQVPEVAADQPAGRQQQNQCRRQTHRHDIAQPVGNPSPQTQAEHRRQRHNQLDAAILKIRKLQIIEHVQREKRRRKIRPEVNQRKGQDEFAVGVRMHLADEIRKRNPLLRLMMNVDRLIMPEQYARGHPSRRHADKPQHGKDRNHIVGAVQRQSRPHAGQELRQRHHARAKAEILAAHPSRHDVAHPVGPGPGTDTIGRGGNQHRHDAAPDGMLWNQINHQCKRDQKQGLQGGAENHQCAIIFRPA